MYWQPGVRVDRSTFVVGAGIGDFAEVTIEPARFEITKRGVDIHVAFYRYAGRRPGDFFERSERTKGPLGSSRFDPNGQ